MRGMYCAAALALALSMAPVAMAQPGRFGGGFGPSKDSTELKELRERVKSLEEKLSKGASPSDGRGDARAAMEAKFKEKMEQFKKAFEEKRGGFGGPDFKKIMEARKADWGKKESSSSSKQAAGPKGPPSWSRNYGPYQGRWSPAGRSQDSDRKGDGKGPPWARSGSKGGPPSASSRDGSQDRFAQLERRLDRLAEELESLRREIRRGRR